MPAEKEPIVTEATFQADAETVWNAITDVEEMRRWYFSDLTAFEPTVGFETRFDVESESRVFPHVWTVTEVVPNKRIQYDWRYEGYPGDSFVVFELSENDGQTTLRVTHTERESFPSDIPEFERQSGVDGWYYFICQRLTIYLAPE